MPAFSGCQEDQYSEQVPLLRSTQAVGSELTKNRNCRCKRLSVCTPAPVNTLLNALDRYPGVIRAGSAASGMGVLLYDAWLLLKKGKWFRKLGMVFVTAGAVTGTAGASGYPSSPRLL